MLNTTQRSASCVLGPLVFFHIPLAETHRFHSWKDQGGRPGVCALPVLRPGGRLTSLCALQFSSLREEKKHQEMMGLIEKENLVLRQVMAWAYLKAGLGLGYHDGQKEIGASSQLSW